MWSLRCTRVRSRSSALADTEKAMKLLDKFLNTPGPGVHCIAGPSGSGKLRAATNAAQKRGFQAIIFDRALEKKLNYQVFGMAALAPEGGVKPTLHTICGAETETNVAALKKLPAKILCIANDASNLRRAGVTIDYMKRPTPQEMTRTLYLDEGWNIDKATRLSKLACGDWRRLWALDRLITAWGGRGGSL